MIVYGLKACDTCRKALKALQAAGHPAQLRDVRAEPLDPETLTRFEAAFGAALLNTRSTTWRGLDEDTRKTPAIELLQEHPALMKRPVIEADGRLTLGWTKDVQATWIS
ncbi:arsenate reductase family protein [Nereida sp. MMG025]|uniref:arsenate reductase family protein n=1 Tax=Nereida sp. MMG025 TaxID=2909981 RepID=UPI001F1A8CA5|nr:ArsC/Spx/MgsR family protein [Nereida sp. MMG025]MCF6443875.1 arsenate reductase [Nereida sp. MMG025]